MRYFNASHILEDDPAALRTYNFQTCHHGLARAGQGLPQEMANMVLLQAVNENLIALAEDGLPAPPLLIVWVKGHEKAIHHRASKNTPGGSSDPHQESRGRRLSHGDEPGPDRSRTTNDAGKSLSLRRMAAQPGSGLCAHRQTPHAMRTRVPARSCLDQEVSI